MRSTFDWKTDFSPTTANDLTFGTEIQQSRTLATSYRFLGTDDANPLKVQDISKGSIFKTITNQYAYFVHNRTDFNALDMALIVGLSANQINYSRFDLLANNGLVTGYGKIRVSTSRRNHA